MLKIYLYNIILLLLLLLLTYWEFFNGGVATEKWIYGDLSQNGPSVGCAALSAPDWPSKHLPSHQSVGTIE